jgi:hypothetical protein
MVTWKPGLVCPGLALSRAAKLLAAALLIGSSSLSTIAGHFLLRFTAIRYHHSEPTPVNKAIINSPENSHFLLLILQVPHACLGFPGLHALQIVALGAGQIVDILER